MKKTLLLSIILAVITFTSCKKDDPIVDSGVGRVTFYNNQSAVGSITVTVDNLYSDIITVTTTATGCDVTNCANFSLSSGNHSFSASATTGETWSGTFNISSDGCLKFLLF